MPRHREFKDGPGGRWWLFDDSKELFELRVIYGNPVRQEMYGRWVTVGYFDSVEAAQQSYGELVALGMLSAESNAMIRPTAEYVWRNYQTKDDQ